MRHDAGTLFVNVRRFYECSEENLECIDMFRYAPKYLSEYCGISSSVYFDWAEKETKRTARGRSFKHSMYK